MTFHEGNDKLFVMFVSREGLPEALLHQEGDVMTFENQKAIQKYMRGEGISKGSYRIFNWKAY